MYVPYNHVWVLQEDFFFFFYKSSCPSQMTTVIHLGPSLFDIHSCKKCIAVSCVGKFLFFTLFILI